MNSQHILIIEDDETLGGILMRKLLEQGYRATWEKGGSEGLRRAITLHPDLILLDLALPGVHGEEVLREVRSDKTLSSIPVLIVSNTDDPTIKERMLAAGAADFLVKSAMNPTDIVLRVSRQFGGETPASSSPASRKRIMIVEDDPMLLSLASEEFQKSGFIVLTAMDGKECLEKLSVGTLPDVILLDVIMPGEDGFSILQKLKNDPRTKNISIIIFSNYAHNDDVGTAKRLGALDFIVKSKMTLREMIDRINEILAKI